MRYERTGPLGIGSVSFNNNDDMMRWKETRLPGEEGKWNVLSPLNPDAILKRIEELIRENERLGMEIEKLRRGREEKGDVARTDSPRPDSEADASPWQAALGGDEDVAYVDGPCGRVSLDRPWYPGERQQAEAARKRTGDGRFPPD